MRDNREVKYIKNFEYIDYLGNKPDKESKNCSGYIDIRLECVSDLYIGSGFAGGSDKFCYECVKYDQKPFIPGSSLKGAVRNIAETVSYNCCGVAKEKQCTFEGKDKSKDKELELCIICDTFGVMGRASKVIFGNLMPEKYTVNIKELNKQYKPNAKNTGRFKEYKSNVRTYKADEQIRVEVVEKGSVFSGRLHFKNLSRRQLSLLLFSLGIDETICLRLGGYKNEGLGVARVTVDTLIVNGAKKEAKSEAMQYSLNCDDAIGENIKALRKLLKPLRKEKT